MRRSEVTSISLDVVARENLEYVLQSHYCNSLGQSAYIRALIAKDAAEKRMLDSVAAMPPEVTSLHGNMAGQSAAVMR